MDQILTLNKILSAYRINIRVHFHLNMKYCPMMALKVIAKKYIMYVYPTSTQSNTKNADWFILIPISCQLEGVCNNSHAKSTSPGNEWCWTKVWKIFIRNDLQNTYVLL